MMLWKASLLDLPIRIGSPRYMEQVGLGLNGRIFRMDKEVGGLVFLLNLMEDFLELIDWPDHEQYLSRQPFILVASRIKAFPNSKRSSANNR